MPGKARSLRFLWKTRGFPVILEWQLLDSYLLLGLWFPTMNDVFRAAKRRLSYPGPVLSLYCTPE